MSIHKKIEIENLAKAFESVMHTVAHGEAYRQVSDVLTTVNANAQRIDALETTDEVVTKALFEEAWVGQALANAALSNEMHTALANFTTPEDERIAELQTQVARLEQQMTEIIRLLGAVGELD